MQWKETTMTNSDFVAFISYLNTIDRYIDKAAFVKDSKEVMEYLATIFVNDKEEYKKLRDEIVASFEGLGKETQIKRLLKTILEEILEEGKKDRLGRFTSVDAKTLVGKNGGYAWTPDNLRRMLEQAKHVRFSWDTFSKQAFIPELSWEELAQPYELPLYDGVVKLQRWKETYNQTKFKELLNQGPFPLENTFKELNEIVIAIAMETEKFDSPQRWLESFPPWDGVDRFTIPESSWPVQFLKPTNPKWAAVWGRMLFLLIVTKIMDPKFRTRNYIILEGEQETGKSSLCEELIPMVWHIERTIKRDDDIVEFSRHVATKLIAELPELGGKDQISNNSLKLLTTLRRFSFRPMHKDDVSEPDNRCTFFVTTNDSRYLSDPTGETRPLILTSGLAQRTFPDWTLFRQILPQLYAQALHMWRSGVLPYLDGDEEKEMQRNENEQREIISQEEEMISEYLQANMNDVKEYGLQIKEIVTWCKLHDQWMHIFSNGFTGRDTKVRDALIRAGLKNTSKRINGIVSNRWVFK
jgi:predicted P-loop ATPase